jgi:glutaminyl-tRNA synthetase
MSKPNEQDSNSLVSLFKSIGLTQTKAADAVKAPKSANILKEIIESNAVVAGGLDEKKASLISTLAILLSKASAVGFDEREYLINCILHSKLKSVDQITGEGLIAIAICPWLIF